MPSTHEIDDRKRRSYELSVCADKAAAQGDLDRARELMREAASLNRKYSVRAKFVGSVDERRVRVTATIRRLILPSVYAAGFELEGGVRQWSQGAVLQRTRGPFTHDLLLGSGKFGKSLGVAASRYSEATGAALFDWHELGFRSGELAYRTQEELEAVCEEWRGLLNEHVFPWLDATP